MREINRIKPTLEEIEKLWLSNPDLRFGQLVMNIIRPEEPNMKTFYIEDDEFLKKLDELKIIKKRKMSDELENFNVSDRKSFGTFIELLRKDLAENPKEWENKSLEDFLEALSAYSKDIQGYYNNMDIEVDADEPNWKTFADMFLGAKVYE